MKRKIVSDFFIFICLFVVSAACPVVSVGEAAQQTINLEPGWNSVYLEIDPGSTDPEQVFAGLPVLSVWTWNPDTSTQQYIQSPDTLIPKDPQWSAWFPPSSPEHVFSDLFAIYGGKSYLVRIDGQTRVPLTVNGSACLPRTEWKDDSYNFMGFQLVGGSEPFFEDFFSSSTGPDARKIFILGESGQWEQVQFPSMTRMRSGEAFWIYCDGHSEFQGPLSVGTGQHDGLRFGSSMVVQQLRISNNSLSDANVSVSASGGLPIKFLNYDPEQNIAEWLDLPMTASVPAGGEKVVGLAVVRTSMQTRSVQESTLEVANDAGTRLLIPVSAEASETAGLWVGNAIVKQVSELTTAGGAYTLKPAGGEFGFRLILHSNELNQVKLLREVVQMWQDGTTKPDPENPEYVIVDQPGSYVLIANDALIGPPYKGAGLRDGQPVGRRISSAAFGFSTPVQMTGAISIGSILSCSLALEPDDARNPFRHMYHRDHDEPDESYRIVRDIELEFTQTYPGEIDSLGWGDSELGGNYRETITFAGRKSIHVGGIFVIKRVCDVATLLE